MIDAYKASRRELCNLLEAHDYHVIPSNSLAGLPGLIRGSSCRAVILDLDTVPVNNRHLRDIKKTFPDLYVVAVSDRSFHPEAEGGDGSLHLRLPLQTGRSRGASLLVEKHFPH